MRGYRFAFIGSLLFHVGVGILLLFSIDFTKTIKMARPLPTEPQAIDAILVDRAKLSQEIARLDQIEKN
ncbi:MAG TPA: cell envelope integrity protein TolA, partial [Gammaproteobacteria bacterium]|nr:cell envelope integrity protein TolA [Gammaproteobacteria bacterium]